MAENEKKCCPHCGSNEGAESKIVFEHSAYYGWDGEFDASAVQRTVSETIPACVSCGKRVPQLRARRLSGGST